MASLVSSSCSWRRSSVISRHKTIAPVRAPFLRRGIARIERVKFVDSRSARQGALPVRTSGKDSSTVDCFLTILVAASARDFPSSSPTIPRRLKADNPFGLAKVTIPSTSSLSKPSLARGAPRLGPVGVEKSGKLPSEIIVSNSLPQFT
ncbi:unannotated protein [freshwater metagenome]|uniref:Unannotated protein n=1 Tax=freshwater metagenome TaxID=449393 RepID=A0A6J6M5C7_9ZZZZ